MTPAACCKMVLQKACMLLGAIGMGWGTIDIFDRLNNATGFQNPGFDKEKLHYVLGVLITIGKIAMHAVLVIGASKKSKCTCLIWIIVSVAYIILLSLGTLSTFYHNISPDSEGRGRDLFIEVIAILLVTVFVMELNCHMRQEQVQPSTPAAPANTPVSVVTLTPQIGTPNPNHPPPVVCQVMTLREHGQYLNTTARSNGPSLHRNCNSLNPSNNSLPKAQHPSKYEPPPPYFHPSETNFHVPTAPDFHKL